jgi:hypothetical protein
MDDSLRFRRDPAAALLVVAAAVATACGTAPAAPVDPVDPITYIRSAFEDSAIVCLAEGGHQARAPHEFLRRVLADETILTAVDVIIVEFASARHQAVLDAYIRGEDVPFESLSSVWRDTGQSPRAPWDSPLYAELLAVIRNGNQGLPPTGRVRVIAGDPPMDWERINSRADYRAARRPRDPFVAELAMEQAFELGKKVLIIFGGAHLPRVPLGPNDPRNSLKFRILSRYPDGVRAIGFLDPENLRVEDRINELVPGMIYPTTGHWVGEIDAGLVFAEIYSLVKDAETGQQSWQNVELYSEHVVRDLFDALIYIGPSSAWGVVSAEFDPVRDEAYLAELNRRSMVRFGRPLSGDG